MEKCKRGIAIVAWNSRPVEGSGWVASAQQATGMHAWYSASIAEAVSLLFLFVFEFVFVL